MPNHIYNLIVLGFVSVAVSMASEASSSPFLKATAGPQEGSSSDASETVTRKLASGVTMTIKVRSYFQDGLKAIETLTDADFKRMTDAKSLELVQHFDAVSSPLIRRANHGEEATAKGSAAKSVWHSNRPVHNHAIFGPYSTLEAGRYLVVYRMMSPKKVNGRLASLDVAVHANGVGSRNVEAKDLPAGQWRTFAIPFTFAKPTPRVEYRIYQHGHPLIFDRIYLFKVR